MEQSKEFQFMLKEYEMIYSKFKMHYDAVERTFRTYLVIVGAILSLIGFFLKEGDQQFGLFELEDFELALLGIVSVTGVFIYFKIVEHRLLIIAYVKSLNLNRKWFEDNLNHDISPYLYFPTGTQGAPFFARWRHFYWEAMILSFLNGLFMATAIINALIAVTDFPSTRPTLVNFIWLIVLVCGFIALQITYYRLRGKKEESKRVSRFPLN